MAETQSSSNEQDSQVSAPQPLTQKISIDDMLKKHCGEFGKWQLRNFTLTSLAWFLEAFNVMIMVFADREPSYRCLTNKCDAAAASLCHLPPSTWQWVGGSAVSTVAQWQLYCNDKFKVGLVQSAFFIGWMIGAGLFGHLSDSALGRKGTFRVVVALSALFTFLTSLSPNYSVYLVLRVLTGFSTSGIGLCTFALTTEPVGPSRRGAVGMSTFYFYSTGVALLSGCAYLCDSWRKLYVAASTLSIIFLLLVLPWISESPRWFLVRGKVNEAMKIMHEIAKTNGKSIPDNVILSDNGDIENNKESASGSLVDVVKTPMTRSRLFFSVAINFLGSLAYNGLSLNVVNIKANIYVTVAICGAAEIPAIAMWSFFLRKYGRKPVTMGTLWFSAVFCFAGWSMNKDGVWSLVRMICGVMSVFGVTGTYNLLYIYTAELFPTVVRSSALGCASQAAQIGALLAPIVVLVGGSFPFAVFGFCGLVGGFFCLCLPETLNRPLYETMEELLNGETP